MSNHIPYLYDRDWAEYLIEYYTFGGYRLVKDLSLYTEQIRCIILIFEKENIDSSGNKTNDKYLFGFDDGIMFPLLPKYDIYNINSDTYKKYLANIIQELVTKIREYYKNPIRIYNYPVYQHKLGFNLFEYLDISNSKTIPMNDLLYITDKYMIEGEINKIEEQFEKKSKKIKELNKLKNNFDELTKGLKYNVRNIINKYKNSKIFTEDKVELYFGSSDKPNMSDVSPIDDRTFQVFKNKHYSLAEKQTKSDRCWEITKEFIKKEKAILARYGNNFIYFLISAPFSYYAINACDRKSDICTILIYSIYMFLYKYNYEFIYMYHLDAVKSFYKKSLSNKIFTNYILEIEPSITPDSAKILQE